LDKTASDDVTAIVSCDWLTVENMAYHKESFVSSRRGQQKRHSAVTSSRRAGARWSRGQASRAVDGLMDQTVHSCTILDNLYVERPVWMVDVGQKITVSGVIIVTWQPAHHYHDRK